MHRLALLVPLSLAWLSTATSVATQPADAFLLAIVRDDGVMLPAAAYDRGRWRSPWPGPAKEAEVPVRIEDCPLAWWGLPVAPRQWTLHVPDESPRVIPSGRLTWVPSYCRQQLVLHSRAATRPLLRAADGERAPKYGVAAAGPAAVELPRSVSPESAEARQLLDALQRTFNQEERLMLAGEYFAVHQPSMPERERDRIPVQAVSIYAGSGRGGETAYFVELQRRYPRRRPEHLRWCDEVTYMAGWVRPRRDERLGLTVLVRAVTSCLLDTVQRAEPLAIVSTAAGPAWMLELYRPGVEMLGVFLAPDGDTPEPLLVRTIGACGDRRPPPATEIMGLPDVSVP